MGYDIGELVFLHYMHIYIIAFFLFLQISLHPFAYSQQLIIKEVVQGIHSQKSFLLSIHGLYISKEAVTSNSIVKENIFWLVLKIRRNNYNKSYNATLPQHVALKVDEFHTHRGFGSLINATKPHISQLRVEIPLSSARAVSGLLQQLQITNASMYL